MSFRDPSARLCFNEVMRALPRFLAALLVGSIGCADGRVGPVDAPSATLDARAVDTGSVVETDSGPIVELDTGGM